MGKFFYFVLLLTSTLFSQSNSILHIHPNGPKYKKIELGIKSELKNTGTLISLSSKSETEIKNSIESNSPKIVIVSGIEMIRIWKKLQQKYPELHQIPSILFEKGFSENDMGVRSNSCIITYETKLAQYIKNVHQMTGKKPLKIGVLYSSKSADVVRSFQKECLALNVNLYDKEVMAADPENSIKSSVTNLTTHYNVDLLLILDDQTVINNQNINTTWVSQLSGLNIPVAVPADYFYENEPRIGSFSIQPHYSAIGEVIASVINDAKGNDWQLVQKSIYTDKSIFFSRNSDGSISKQNQTQNDIIATYYPKRADPNVEVQVSSSKPVEIQQDLNLNNPLPVDSVAPVQSDVQHSSDVKIEKQDSKAPEIQLASIQDIDERNKKKEVPVTAPVTGKKHKKTEPVALSTKNNDHILQSETLSANHSIELPEYLDTQMHTTDSQVFLAKTDAVELPQKLKQPEGAGNNYISTIIIIIALIAVILLIYFLYKSRIIIPGNVNKNNCLFITKKKKRIKYSDSINTSISFTRYLKKYGFNIIRTKDLNQISDLLRFNLPEIICIDWEFEPDIQPKLYKILKEHMFSAEFILIFFNVTESSDIKIGYYEDRTFFLNTEFTISDLNKILSIVKKRSYTHKQLDSKSNSQLEGKITEETLSEIFQMMDVNKKTGCLIVETDHPAGMVFFEEGIITYSITNSQIAEAAVFEVLAMKQGRFNFLPGRKPLTRQMQLSVVATLMEQAKYVDEFEVAQ